MPLFFKRFDRNGKYAPEEIHRISGIRLDISEKRIQIEIPFACAEGLFYRILKNRIEITNDLKLFYDSSAEIDSGGVISLLLFGTLVPPLTPFNDVKEFVPGIKYDIDGATFDAKSQPCREWSVPTATDYNMNIKDQMALLGTQLDAYIREICPNRDPIVLFSGGVDSGVLASRVAALSWQDATYIHYSFGPNDPETRIAQEMAAALAVDLEIFTWDIENGFKVLEKSAELYKRPFCDFGCTQSFDLSTSIAKNYRNHRPVLDGTGADGAFGLFNLAMRSKWLYLFPRPMRRLAGSFYNIFGFWRRPQWPEYYLRLLRRSAYLAPIAGFVSQNPLFDIAYYNADNHIREISELCDAWIGRIARTKEDTETLPLIDIGMVCARRFIQKNHDLLIERGFPAAYPYLHHDIIDLAINHCRHWPGSKTPKNVLKAMLVSVVPRELVYRSKQGFLSPVKKMFSHPLMLDHLQTAAGPNAPLANYVNRSMLQQLTDIVARGQGLPFQTYNFLWSVVFLSSWLTLLRERKIANAVGE